MNRKSLSNVFLYYYFAEMFTTGFLEIEEPEPPPVDGATY